jgi:hypothetical protein
MCTLRHDLAPRLHERFDVLARLFRGKMLAMLMDARAAGQLRFFNTDAGLADKHMFKRFVAPLHHIDWAVYCKAPFAGPNQVLRYLSRYTHRVAISNHRLVAADDTGIAFRGKDYLADGEGRWKMTRALLGVAPSAAEPQKSRMSHRKGPPVLPCPARTAAPA